MLNKLINYDFKNQSDWLKVNRIALNVIKAEFVTFKPKRKKLDFEFEIKFNGKEVKKTFSDKFSQIFGYKN